MFTVLSTKLLPLLLLVMPRRDPSSFSAQSGRSLILDPGVSASLCFLAQSSLPDPGLLLVSCPDPSSGGCGEREKEGLGNNPGWKCPERRNSATGVD